MSYFIAFLNWYFIRAPKAHLYFAKNTTLLIEDSFGVITNLVYFFKPWYGDTSFVGRLLSIFVRTITIIIGLISVSAVALILFSIPVVWLGSIFIAFLLPEILLLPLLSFLYFITIGHKKPKLIYPKSTKPKFIIDAMHQSAKDLFILFPSNQFFQEIKSSSKLARFIIKSNLPIEEIIDQVTSISTKIRPEQLLASIQDLIQKHNLRSIRVTHIFVAFLYEYKEQLESIFENHNISFKDLGNFIEWDEFEYQISHPPQPFDEDFLSHTGGGTNRSRLGVVTPYLNQVSVDYTREVVNYLNKVRIVRPQLIKQIESILEKNENANVILRGEKGTGKEALVWQIAHLIQFGDLKGALWSKRIVGIDFGALIGSSNSGNYAENVKQIVNEITRSKNIILYINDVQPGVDSGKSGLSILSLLQEPISHKKCSLIIACTHMEYSHLNDTQPKLVDECEIIDINETNYDETIHILHTHALDLEQKYYVVIPYSSLKILYNYAFNYLHNTPFPQKAITLMEDTVIEATRGNQFYSKTPWGPRIIIQEPQIAFTLTEKTHIPVGSVHKNEAQVLLHLNEVLEKVIVGQTQAIEAIVKVMQRNRAGVRTSTKPIGSFLFAGPTGVGKTHVAKMLAKHYFGSEKAMIRLDMSEYQNQDTIERLLSSESGYLIEHVRNTPFALILLDEVEKAHPKILDIFLQVLDDARLTDVQGNTCDFSQTIIIATSNAGNTELSALSRDHLYFQNATKVLHTYFRTEFLNRFDDIIPFTSLSQNEIEQIVDIKISNLSEKLYEDKKIHVEVTPETKKWLATFGYSPDLGARNLTRLIQDTIETNLAKKILSGEITSGQTIQV